ncbi:hypothetical protein AAZX31_15G206000 [Glycine max]
MGSAQQAAVSFLTNLAHALLPLHVDDGQLVVLFDRFRGILNETIGEGTHFLIPWVQKPYIFDIRTHTHTFSFVSGTKDLQMVNQTLCNLGLEYNEKVLPSIGNEVLKAVVAQFNTDQLLTDRPHLSALIILLDDVAITHLSYGIEFSRAVEQKQVAQQEAERQVAIIRAEGESDTVKLISDATVSAGMGLIELRRIEASREIAATLAKSPNVAYLLGGKNLLMALNAGGC